MPSWTKLEAKRRLGGHFSCPSAASIEDKSRIGAWIARDTSALQKQQSTFSRQVLMVREQQAHEGTEGAAISDRRQKTAQTLSATGNAARKKAVIIRGWLLVWKLQWIGSNLASVESRFERANGSQSNQRQNGRRSGISRGRVAGGRVHGMPRQRSIERTLVCVAGHMSRKRRSNLDADTSSRQWSVGLAKAETRAEGSTPC